MRGVSCVLVTTTVNSKEKASAMARDLVSQKLAACVQTAPVGSTYIWDGELVEDQEVLMMIKTTSERYPQLEGWITHHHDDELPEILCCEITGGLPAYTRWIEASVRP